MVSFFFFLIYLILYIFRQNFEPIQKKAFAKAIIEMTILRKIFRICKKFIGFDRNNASVYMTICYDCDINVENITNEKFSKYIFNYLKGNFGDLAELVEVNIFFCKKFTNIIFRIYRIKKGSK